MVDKDIFNKVDFVGSKGLIYIGNKVPIFRRDNKTKNFPLMLDLPGGGREEGESPFGTFQREVQEEFGILIKDSDIVYAKKYRSYFEPNQDAFFFVVRPTSISECDIKFGDEGLGYLLMTPEEFILDAKSIPFQVERIREYLKATSYPVLSGPE